MLTQRRWTAAEFRDLIVAHPLLSHIARRLVWLAHLPAVAAFRVAEDRSFADAHDDAFALPPEATVAVAHPLQLGADLPAWSELFADYELLQPFPQLSRPVHILTEPERTATDLTRFAGLSVPTTTLLGLERRGWHRSAPQDAGIQHSMWRPTADGRAVVIDLDPGIAIGALAVLPDQRITHVTVTAAFATAHARAPRTPGPDRTFGSLDPITASELLRDLTDTLTP